jgi:hypothetical protein
VTDASPDRVADADRLVAGIAPGVGPDPGVETGDVVLVTGPWLAGATSLIAALRDRLPEHALVETRDLAITEAPKAVVFVASAVAPLTESDCALLDLATSSTDLVIGVVSKIDAHPSWSEVLAADKQVLCAHADRYRDMVWVGVAAAPEVGEPNVDELVDVMRQRLDDSELPRRNRLRAWETRLQAAAQRCEEEAEGAGRDARMAELREQRTAAVQQRQLTQSERSSDLGRRIEQARVQLTQFARNRCSSVHSELTEDVTAMMRRRLGAFEDYVRKRVDEVVAEVNFGVNTHLSDVATELGVTPPPAPPPPPSPLVPSPTLKPHGLQIWLMVLLGACVGVGLASAVTLLVAKLAPGYTVAALVAAGVVGSIVAVSAVAMLGLRRDRAELDRWLSGIIAELRAAVEQLVSRRVPTAETALTDELARLDEAEAAQLADRVATIDSELRDHGLAAAKAVARRNRDLPKLQGALDAVRSELGPAPDAAPASDQPREHFG